MEHVAENSPPDSDVESQKPGLWRRFKNRLGLPGKNKPAQSFREKIRQLTISQWCYLVAFVLLLLIVGNPEEVPAGVIGQGVILLAAIGLTREMWHLFHTIWEKTLGKGILLVLYAGTANFALAIAALKISNIAGVEPTPFIFTLGFTTFLTLPFWLVAATIVFFSVALVAGNLWLLVSLMLRLVGIRVPVHWEDKSFVILFMLLRLIMIPALIIGLVKLVEPYARQMDVFDQQLTGFSSPMGEEQQQTRAGERRNGLSALLAKLDNPGGDNTKAKRQAQPSTPEQPEMATRLASPGPDAQSDFPENQQADSPVAASSAKPRFLDQMVAHFIYHFETYPHSACAKRPEQHALTIDDYSMFVAEKDDSPLGYSFSVEPCVPRYTQAHSEAGQ